MLKLKLGVYEHYKGKRYRVLCVAKHSETLEDMVVYEKCQGDFGVWVRPLDMFTEEVEVKGKRVKRFEFVEVGVGKDDVAPFDTFTGRAVKRGFQGF